MPVTFYTVDIKFNLPHKRIYKNWISGVITSHDFLVGDITYIFCSEEEILRINNEYLTHNFYTDIITFPYTEQNIISADIYISIPTVKSNSEKFKQTFIDELNRVIIHGVLHLIGRNDLTDEEKLQMREAENHCLTVLNSLM